MSDHDKIVSEVKKVREALDNIENNTSAPDVDYRHPDPIKHKYISFVKSALRIFAGVALGYSALTVAGLFLIIAEVFGVVEEMV